MSSYRMRRIIAVIMVLLLAGAGLASQPASQFELPFITGGTDTNEIPTNLATLPVKGRAPKTGYERSQFGDGWQAVNGCDMRNIILARDLVDEIVTDDCKVQSGVLDDPYTGKKIMFVRGETTSDDVQIDHVVALSDAWQKGAQALTYEQRVGLANDPLNLLAVAGEANQKKSDSDAASWLPPNKGFRCEYVERQVRVKQKYSLWVTAAERDAIARTLSTCKTGTN